MEMRGWGAPVDGDWVTTRASHRIGGATGYVTEHSAELRTPCATGFATYRLGTFAGRY